MVGGQNLVAWEGGKRVKAREEGKKKREFYCHMKKSKSTHYFGGRELARYIAQRGSVQSKKRQRVQKS